MNRKVIMTDLNSDPKFFQAQKDVEEIVTCDQKYLVIYLLNYRVIRIGANV